MRTPDPKRLLALLLVGFSAACGGSGSSQVETPAPVPATSLSYVDPAATGWRLVADPSSTSTRIVLNLVGPPGQLSRGVGFNLKAPAGVRFEALDAGMPVHDLGVYELRSAGATEDEPTAFVGGVKQGNVLSVGIYQKDRDRSPKDSGVAVLQIAFSLDPAAPPVAGTTLALTVPKARIIPSDIGAVTDETYLLDRKMRMVDVSVAVGTLTAN